MTRSFLRLGIVILAFGSACDNCQSTSPGTQPACLPNTGDPAPNSSGNCANIGGASAIRVCINRCKAVAALGQPCTIDLCHDGGAVCDVKLACLPASGGGFACASPSSAACDPNQSAVANGCTSGTFCKQFGPGACPGLNAPATLCAGVAAEGTTCDGDYSAVNAIPGLCAPCELGTICVKPSGSSTGKCQRACDPANQQASCPCTGFRCIMTGGVTPSGAYCDQCAATNHGCAVMSGGTAPCCDPSAQCTGATGNVCCRPNATACTSAGQCCGAANASPTCTGGACGFACNAGFGDCNHSPGDGCEVDLNTSASNCGSCGHVCTGGPAGGSEICAGGACVAHCPTGLTLCGSTCVNTQTDTNHCGSCTHVCSGAPTGGTVTCSSSVCTPHCPSGLTNCGNHCVNTQTDPNNCGSCGHSCGGQACTGATCAPGCEPWGTSCGPGVTCCAGTTCMTVPATSTMDCCHGIDQFTQTCN